MLMLLFFILGFIARHLIVIKPTLYDCLKLPTENAVSACIKFYGYGQ